MKSGTGYVEGGLVLSTGAPNPDNKYDYYPYCGGNEAWGWTNLLKTGITIKKNIWVGAGQNDVEKGWKLGEMTCFYDSTKKEIHLELTIT